MRAPGRYFGSEANAAAVVAETLDEAGVRDCRLGIADDLFTAEQAARRSRVQECEVVAEGGSAAYLQALPVEVLAADGAEGREAVSLLRRLGLRSLGDLAALPADAVQHRFGTYGTQVWRQARGAAPTLIAARTPPPDLDAEIAFEPALDSVEAICFSVRTTAERLVADLASRQLVATGVRIEAEHDGLVASSRTWLHPRFFSARDLVDRVHWQLQAGTSLRSRHDSGAVRAPVERMRFVPEVVEPAAAHTEGLWGGSGEELIERGVARVQAMIGFDAVTRPVLQGGRGPADRQAAVPWGERPSGLRPVDRPWPGRIPGPAPCRVFAAPLEAEVRDHVGRPVGGDRAGRRHRRAVAARASTAAGNRSRPGPGRGRSTSRGGPRAVPVARRASRWWASTAARGCWSAGRPAGVPKPGTTDGGRLMGWKNPGISWKELERRLSGLPGADDAPISRRKRHRPVASANRAPESRRRTPSCTATATSASWTARPRRPSWSTRRSGWACTRWPSPTTTASTGRRCWPRRRRRTGSRRSTAPSSRSGWAARRTGSPTRRVSTCWSWRAGSRATTGWRPR